MLSKKNVLIVEDSLIDREMLSEILSNTYNVFQAEDGQCALNFLRETKDNISIILLDINMPVMDGYAFLREIKNDSRLSMIPVVITTESNDIDSEIEAFSLGAIDFITKPYNPVIILKHIENFIKFSETNSFIRKYQYDQLTGVYTKEHFYNKVSEILRHSQEEKYVLIATNIENFKLFNDTFGRIEGDKLLVEVSKYFKIHLGNNSILGRFSADRFLCFTTREFVDELHSFGNYNTQIRENVIIRYGVYNIIDKSISVEQMCDRALLVADTIKGQYDTYFAIYDDVLRSTLHRNKLINDTMEEGILKKQFKVYLQPKYSIKDGKIIGCEALVRWEHPILGFLTPGDFIPLFEENGFIFKMNNYVWDEVCSLIASWKNKGIKLLPISVNISRSDCLRCNLGELFRSLVDRYGIDSKYFHVEITENVYVNNPDHIIKSLEEIKNNSFKIEMDDFGSGYSSLNMLSQISVDVLKLDMSFISNETKKTEEESILSDVINMAHRLRLKVVAEGVEEEYQVRRLTNCGCDFAQGYYYAKPMPVEDFLNVLNKN